MSSPSETRRPRRPLWPWVVAAILCLVLLQSFTITPAVHGRIVDGTSNAPIKGARVVAVWRVQGDSLAGAIQGPSLRVQATLTGDQGRYDLPTVVLLHPPVFPFTWWDRSDDMPAVLVLAPGYYGARVSNDPWATDRPRLKSVLFLRRSNVDSRDIPMRREGQIDGEIMSYKMSLEAVEGEIVEQGMECRDQGLCKLVDPNGIIDEIYKGQLEQVRNAWH
jgi:hypothetical protein